MGWRKSAEEKNENYVKSELVEYGSNDENKSTYGRKVKVEGNREDYVSKVGRTLIEDDPTA